MVKVAFVAPAEKRTGVYGEEDWRETIPGEYHITVEGVSHIYIPGPEIPGNHRHVRNGVSQNYGLHTHTRWDEPHRHLHPGDKNPTTNTNGSAHPERTGRQGDLPREEIRKDTHHAHRIYVNEAVTINEALDALALAVRVGSAAYEDGRWKDAHQRYIAAQDASEAALAAAGKIVAAMSELWRDGGPNDRRTVEFESQVKGTRYKPKQAA